MKGFYIVLDRHGGVEAAPRATDAACARSVVRDIQRSALEAAAREPSLRRQLAKMVLTPATPPAIIGAVLARRLVSHRDDVATVRGLVAETLIDDPAVLPYARGRSRGGVGPRPGVPLAAARAAALQGLPTPCRRTGSRTACGAAGGKTPRHGSRTSRRLHCKSTSIRRCFSGAAWVIDHATGICRHWRDRRGGRRRHDLPRRDARCHRQAARRSPAESAPRRGAGRRREGAWQCGGGPRQPRRRRRRCGPRGSSALHGCRNSGAGSTPSTSKWRHERLQLVLASGSPCAHSPAWSARERCKEHKRARDGVVLWKPHASDVDVIFMMRSG